jgi:CIC family chloride channel protein
MVGGNPTQSERKGSSNYRIHRINENAIILLLAVIVGVAGGYGAVGFRLLIQFFQNIFYGDGRDILEAVVHIPWYKRILIPAVGGLIIGPVVYFFAREAKGHGVPEVMDAVALKGGRIRKRVCAIKCLVSSICIGSGGSVGREGPIVQIGSAVGSMLGQLIKAPVSRMRILVGCGAAAGIAATFNAPIAGSIFALEIVLGEFEIITFSPIVLSAVVATVISRYHLGNFPAFMVPKYNLVSIWEIPLYTLLGAIAGLVALLFTVTLYKFEDIFDYIRFPEYLKASVGGLLLGSIAVFFPYILGVGYESINLAMAGKLAWWLLGSLIILKMLATSISLGSGGSGGIFAPSLFIGSMTGGAFGYLAHTIFPSVTALSGAYSLVGMGAVVAGTTHGPISAILILFEMTDDYKIILPLMVACIISSLLASQLKRGSIYTLKLLRRGVDIRAGKEINVLRSLSVGDFMSRHVETVSDDMPLKDLRNFVSNSKYISFPVLNTQGLLSGILSVSDYREALFSEDLERIVVVKDIATEMVVTVSRGDDLYTAFQRIADRSFETLPVVDEMNSRKVVGILSRRDIISAYNRAVIKKTTTFPPLP